MLAKEAGKAIEKASEKSLIKAEVAAKEQAEANVQMQAALINANQSVVAAEQ